MSPSICVEAVEKLGEQVSMILSKFMVSRESSDGEVQYKIHVHFTNSPFYYFMSGLTICL